MSCWLPTTISLRLRSWTGGPQSRYTYKAPQVKALPASRTLVELVQHLRLVPGAGRAGVALSSKMCVQCRLCSDIGGVCLAVNQLVPSFHVRCGVVRSVPFGWVSSALIGVRVTSI